MSDSRNKKRARSRAKTVKRYLIRACVVCEFDITTVAHHIKEVAQGGNSEATNLIVLCPNCHAVVHLLPKSAHGRINKYRMARLRNHYSDAQIALLLSVRRGSVVAQHGEYWSDITWAADADSLEYVTSYDAEQGWSYASGPMPSLADTLKSLMQMEGSDGR